MAETGRDNHESRWPFLLSLRSFRAADLPGDIIAGLTLAAIAIPEQMATARLGHFPPQIGFLAFIMGSIGFAMFGANRLLSCGADSTITPIFAGGLLLMAASHSPEYQALAVALALMVGVILVLASLFRMGWIANLLSRPVTVGFLVGIAVHIVVSQLPAVLGLPSPRGPMIERLIELAQQIGAANPYAIGIGIGVLAIVAGAEFVSPRVPGALIGLVASTAAVIAAGLESKGVAVVGTIPATLPIPSLPEIAPEKWAKLTPLALLIAIVVMVQTAATTRAFPFEPNRPARVDLDFLGTGAGSVLAGLFGAFPVNASPPRTGIVVETGGRTQLSGLIAAAIVLGLLVFGAALLRPIPVAALAGVLLFVALRIIRAREIARIFRQSRGEFLLIVATAAAIIVLPIEQGVAVGIGLSLLHGIWSTTKARVVAFEHLPGTTIWWPANPHVPGEQSPGIAVIGLQAPLTFLNAENFSIDITGILKSEPKPGLVVLEASGILELDFTAAQSLLQVIDEYRRQHVTLAVARLESVHTQRAFERFGIYDRLPREHVFRSVDEAIRAFGSKI